MPRSTRNDRVGNRIEGDQYSFEGGRGRYQSGAGEWNRTTDLRFTKTRSTRIPTITIPCQIKGKRRAERGLAHGFLAVSCIGCEGELPRVSWTPS